MAQHDQIGQLFIYTTYVPHLPSGGEIVLFDRSWYNRSGVERVMGFASAEQVEQFFQDVPEFERMLVRSGIRLIKYWFSFTDEEQQLRFLMRIHDPPLPDRVFNPNYYREPLPERLFVPNHY